MKKEDAVNNLPGDLKEVAELIGVENTLALVERFGGTYVKIPKCDALLREIRNNEIRRLYDAGEYTIRTLALKFRLTDRQISSVLAEDGTDMEPTLFDILRRNT